MLLTLLIIACGGVPVIENPNSTLINFHHRFRWLVAVLRARGISQPAENIVFFLCWGGPWTFVPFWGLWQVGNRLQIHNAKRLRFLPPSNLDEALWPPLPEEDTALVGIQGDSTAWLGPCSKRGWQILGQNHHQVQRQARAYQIQGQWKRSERNPAP